jgi:uncharacterized protein YndB with AHSA1/START domain
MIESGPQANSARRRITLERRYAAPLEDVWGLWTTKEGIASWWGPDGFTVTVRHLDLRVGGDLIYSMTATAPEQVEFMQRAGMPITTEASIVYTEIDPMRLLRYTSSADFIPEVAPYEVATTVAFVEEPGGIRLVLTFDAMHDAEWTERAVMGRSAELARLETALASSR